ncbi:MAG: hypothetical protein ACTHZX_01990 [Microbacterium sp.]
MQWDSFFQDLEDQLSAEWEAERAALDSEAERLRVARLELRERIGGLVAAGRSRGGMRLETVDGRIHDAEVDAVGADWLSARLGDRTVLLVRLDALSGIAVAEEELVASARAGAARSDRLAERVTFGFALRDLARRRVGVTLSTRAGRQLSGTLDRVAADHVDLAMHEPGAPRRSGEVRGFRLVPMAEIASARIDAAAGTALG